MVYVPAIQKALLSFCAVKTISHKSFPRLSWRHKKNKKTHSGYASLCLARSPFFHTHTHTLTLKIEAWCNEKKTEGAFLSFHLMTGKSSKDLICRETAAAWLIILQTKVCAGFANCKRWTPARDLEAVTDYVMRTTGPAADCGIYVRPVSGRSTQKYSSSVPIITVWASVGCTTSCSNRIKIIELTLESTATRLRRVYFNFST